MKLTLRLTDHDTETGQTRTLEAGRLAIGRGAENDWVLADPDRTLSKTHCRIDGADGRFMLTDLSTNGVFLSGAAQALGRGQSCELQDGDVFAIGPYRLYADIEGAPQAMGLSAAELDGNFGQPAAASVSPLVPVIPEPWLTDVPSSGFGPDRRAAPQGWDAPPDPAAYAATGLFERPGAGHAGAVPDDPFANAPQAFAQQSEHIAASSTVMRIPEAQMVLPTNWMETDPVEPAASPTSLAPVVLPQGVAPQSLAPQSLAPQSLAPQSLAGPAAAPAWPPALPAEPPAATWPPALPPEPEPAPALPADWVLPDPAASAPSDSRWDAPVAPPPAVALMANILPPEPLPVAPVVVQPPAPLPRAVPAPAPPRPAPPQVRPKAAPIADTADVARSAPDRLMRAFLEGAGLPGDTLAGRDAEEAFRDIGQMVRAAVEGVRDIMSTRALVKSEFRVDQTVLRRSDNNAVKFAPDAQRCLSAMVGAAPPGFLPGPAAMKQSMDDIKMHELALVAALNSVFADLDQLMDPEAIARRARQDTGLATMLPYAREAKCWAIYQENHRVLQDSGASNTGGSLLAPLAKAYARQLRRSS